MLWYAHAWLPGSTAVAVALVLVLAFTLGWAAVVFAVVVTVPTFLLARRWANRRFERPKKQSPPLG